MRATSWNPLMSPSTPPSLSNDFSVNIHKLTLGGCWGPSLPPHAETETRSALCDQPRTSKGDIYHENVRRNRRTAKGRVEMSATLTYCIWSTKCNEEFRYCSGIVIVIPFSSKNRDSDLSSVSLRGRSCMHACIASKQPSWRLVAS